MRKTIQYGVLPEGLVVSRCDNLLAWPVLEFEKIGQGGKGDNGKEFVRGDFNGPVIHKLEKIKLLEAISEYHTLKWTRKVPNSIKNVHRAFWGMRKLKEA